MDNIKRSLTICAGAIIITLAGLSTPYTVRCQPVPTSTPNRPPTEVKVINTPAEPVPVTGTVNVGNLGSSPLPVTGTVNIGNLGNSPLPVRDVDRAVRIPVQYTIPLSMSNGQFGRAETVTIPAGKMLVVEYVSANGLIYTGRIGQVYLQTPTPNSTFNTFTHNFLWKQDGIDFTVSSQARMYATGSLTMGLTRDSNQGPTLTFGSVTGYLIDAPTSH